MAFNRKNLFLTTGPTGDAPRTWSYISGDDALADINTEGYFNEASTILNVYDIIEIRDSANAMSRTFVTSNSAGVVDVANGTVLAATDGD